MILSILNSFFIFKIHPSILVYIPNPFTTDTGYKANMLASLSQLISVNWVELVGFIISVESDILLSR